jgi:hypothetical protein
MLCGVIGVLPFQLNLHPPSSTGFVQVWYLSTKLHGVISHKDIILIFTAVQLSDLMY